MQTGELFYRKASMTTTNSSASGIPKSSSNSEAQVTSLGMSAGRNLSSSSTNRSGTEDLGFGFGMGLDIGMGSSNRIRVKYEDSKKERSRNKLKTKETEKERERTKSDCKETIHSGHFMVSDFEAEAQDDEDELAVPVPDEELNSPIIDRRRTLVKFVATSGSFTKSNSHQQQLSIETSLNKLFQCMSLAYRQKLTSPKWNRFKGIRLRWKDKIRLNNVIWRCWHMQFILRQNTLVCQFASPLDVDTHNKPEAVVLEGKYWKRKLAAVTAEYKKWRMFYRNKILGWTNKDGPEILESMDVLEWSNCVGVSGNYGSTSGNSYGSITGASSGESMMVDEDYMQLMTDTLFSTISSNQPIYFPDPREIARGASLADFIQPSLGPLQPNLDDFMDTLEPLQEFLNFKLAPVPEEEDVFRAGALTNNYPELDLMAPIEQINDLVSESSTKPDQNVQQYSIKAYNTPQVGTVAPIYRNNLSINESYNIIQQEFGAQGGNPVARCTPEKLRQSRPCAKASRMMQQPRQQETEQPPQQQQQPNAYQQVRPHSGAVFQHTAPTSQQQSYQLPIQAVQLNQMTSQVQVAQLSDQTAENTELNAMTGHLQNLATLQSTYPGNPLLQMQQKVIQTLPDSPITTKPYKIVQPQQDFKYSTIATPTFNVQQCKFNANNFKPSLNQQLAPVTTPQTIQSQLMLQPRPVMEQQLGAPSVVATKQTESISTKEEIFAVPKYQMKARNRSRSSSSLTPARVHPPPLVSTASDPALNLNSNVLLAHLLTNNTTTSLYTMSTSDKIIPAVSQTTPVKHILPLLPSAASEQVTASTRQTPVTVQTLPVAQQPIQTGQQQVLLNPNNQTHPQGSPGSPKDSQAHSPQPLSVSPLHSPMSLGSPLSPTRGYLKDSERGQYKEQRRVGHIHAEQKRRYNIKNGFDTLHNLIPQLNQNPSTKLSKAAMLQKGADYIRQLRIERSQLKEEMDHLRHQIESLNTSISNCQSMLPATGAPVSRHRTNKMKEMFDDYVRTRTQDNWKFWIFSILFEPLLISFNTSVSTASIEDLYRSTILWVEQHCSLVDLRPAVLNSLRYLCTATEILSDPGRLPEEALAAVNRNENRRSAQ